MNSPISPLSHTFSSTDGRRGGPRTRRKRRRWRVPVPKAKWGQLSLRWRRVKRKKSRSGRAGEQSRNGDLPWPDLSGNPIPWRCAVGIGSRSCINYRPFDSKEAFLSPKLSSVRLRFPDDQAAKNQKNAKYPWCGVYCYVLLSHKLGDKIKSFSYA